MGRPVHIILNPTSRAGHAARAAHDITRALAERGIDPLLHLTERAGHAFELARNIADSGAEMIVAAGGDGTVHDTANGILRAQRSTALAVMPLGTGNDFAKVVPGAENIAAALETIARPAIRRFDVGLARWNGAEEFFVNGMGTGIDVEVVRQLGRVPSLPGPVKYLLALLRALAVYEAITLTARFNDAAIDRSVMMMAVGNGRCQGGGFYLTPNAAPDDGRLELCIVDAIPLWRVPLLLPLVLRGTHARHGAVSMRSFERVRFEARTGASLYFQLDGELREPRDTHAVDVEIRPAALSVVTAG